MSFHKVFSPIDGLGVTGDQFSVSFAHHRDKRLHVGIIKPASEGAKWEQLLINKTSLLVSFLELPLRLYLTSS